jgi:uroporphyrinogen-III decarboxylase
MEIYLQDLILEPVYVLQLHDIVTSMLKGVIQCFAQAGADAIYFCEDWGIQDRLLISPEMWRQIYKPIYKELCDTAHKYNLAVLMHSCGYIWEILDDLAEVGINAFQFDQPALYGLKKLADKCRKLKVCLWSPIDIQSVLPTGNREIIEKEAEMMVQVFGRNNGGFIAKNYNDLHGIGVKPEWDQWGYVKFKQIMWHNK